MLYFVFFVCFTDLEPVILSEDTMMSGFVPLLSTPLNSTFVKADIDRVCTCEILTYTGLLVLTGLQLPGWLDM